jgi:hypothetical protein
LEDRIAEEDEKRLFNEANKATEKEEDDDEVYKPTQEI